MNPRHSFDVAIVVVAVCFALAPKKRRNKNRNKKTLPPQFCFVLLTPVSCTSYWNRYFDDHGALRLFLVNYCQVPARPGLLIVDDFSMFFPQELKGSERFSYMARTLALLHEATLWHTPSSPPANLIISETLHDNELEPRTLPLLQHWIPLVMLIRIHPPPIPPTPVGHPDAVVRQLWVHQYNQGPDPHKLSYPFTHSPGSGLTSLLPLQHHSSALSSPSQSPLFDSRELRAPVE